jgi:hypothetical protein
VRTGINSLKVRFNRVFGYYIEISKSNLRRCRRLRAQADDRRRRALHHARAEGVRGEGARRRRADPRARARDLRGAARAGGRRGAAHAQDTARALAALDVLAALAETAAWPTTPSRTSTTATSWWPPTSATRSSSGWPAARSCQRRPAGHHRPPARDPDRARTWAASPPTCGRRRCSACWRRRVVRAGARGQARHRRPDVRAGRRLGQHRPRPVHLHGRDAGDGAHPQRRHDRAAWWCSTRSAAAPPPSTA